MLKRTLYPKTKRVSTNPKMVEVTDTKNVLVGDFYFDYIENSYKYKEKKGDIR
jgi:hypothetical protein